MKHKKHLRKQSDDPTVDCTDDDGDDDCDKCDADNASSVPTTPIATSSSALAMEAAGEGGFKQSRLEMALLDTAAAAEKRKEKSGSKCLSTVYC